MASPRSIGRPTIAYVEREGCGFRLLQNQGSDGAPPGNRRFAYYIDVDDVDALHEELKPRLDTLPPRDVHGPADKPYGQRELLVLAPDGNLIAFGAPIGPKPRRREPRAISSQMESSDDSEIAADK